MDENHRSNPTSEEEEKVGKSICPLNSSHSPSSQTDSPTNGAASAMPGMKKTFKKISSQAHLANSQPAAFQLPGLEGLLPAEMNLI